MEYKMGDLVRIREDLQEGQQYGGHKIWYGMLKYRGTCQIIKAVIESGFYLKGDVNCYVWTKDMVEPVESKSDKEMKGENNMKYKIGDLVKIKDSIQAGEKYGECSVIEDMLQFRGLVDTIEYIDQDGDYHLATYNNPYVWNKDMLELVVPIERAASTKELAQAKMDRLDIYEYILNGLEQTYKDKNNDYGNSVADTYEKFGDLSFLVRITDKYNRLLTLCNPNNEQKVKDEKIDDTILDLANYCLLWLVEKEYKNQ